MIDAFMSASRATSSEHLALQPPSLNSPTDISSVDTELQRSMRNVMKLRRGLNLPVSGEQSSKEQLEHMIRRMDNEIQSLSEEVARSEREQYQHRSLLDVADKEKELELASRQFANPTADPADAAEASRKCERLRNELKQAKLFNNSKVAQNMYDEKRIEGLVEQIRQKEECKRRLLSVLGRKSLIMPLSLFGGPKLEDILLTLRMQEKTLEREAKRAEKEHNALKAKVKKAIAEKRIEFAQIHAESAVRKRNEALNYLRLASRMNAVGSKIKSAQNMQKVTRELGTTTKSLEKVMKTMNLEKITATMDKFETQFENLDVVTSTMESSMEGAMATGGQTAQVDDLIAQVAGENGLEQELELLKAPEANKSVAAPAAQEADDINARLQALRN
ncbi:Oidioi.mRNA.OKI2018_I69.PAR.g8884.t1.cds [Oikopleura dioica]|uniref:Oidioi.mRNA.OKI2018_I69.PAR.g8884.t1.cds n=1 Tax=Oikopleura dioica TaxID=34765 RepID=A0ABN7RLL8_OIKDI|nr:Oidioi.mRNA.OKI2018_I69.PAR.g8884.t1.cds [Oikopleura dioica]